MIPFNINYIKGRGDGEDITIVNVYPPPPTPTPNMYVGIVALITVIYTILPGEKLVHLSSYFSGNFPRPFNDKVQYEYKKKGGGSQL